MRPEPRLCEDKRGVSELITEKDIKKIALVLKEGGVALIPTDTVLGLAASVDSEEAVRRIYRMKKRDPSKPLAILIPSVESAWDFIKKTAEIEEFAASNWPGAATLIAESDDGSSYGLRIPDCEPLIRLMELTGPLYATSANISGSPAPARVEEVPDSILNSCDVVAYMGVKPSGTPSRIVDLRSGRARVNIR